jgi:hypothetical protein
VDPVLGREVVEREQRLGVVDDLDHRLGPLHRELRSKGIDNAHRVLAILNVADLGQHPPNARLH